MSTTTYDTGQGNPAGLTGATGATRYVGATASGAPLTGTFAVGDFIVDQTGTFYVCTVAGTPGTWVDASAGSVAYTGITGVPTNRVLGRATAGTGAAEALTPGGGLSISAGAIQSTTAANDAVYTTKGDIVQASASATAARLAVGANGTVFTADSTQTTGGKWVVPTGGAITGSTGATRYAGATTGGPPTTGTFAVGDLVVDQTGGLYVCTSAGSPGTFVNVGRDRNPSPENANGGLGWVYPVECAGGNTTMIAATLFASKVLLPNTISLTNIVVELVTTGTGVDTHCFAGAYTSAGTLIGQSADQATDWQTGGTTGTKTLALVGGPFTVTSTGPASFIWCVTYCGTIAGTGPKFLASKTASGPTMNFGLAAASFRYWRQAVADTVTLPSITPSSNSSGGDGIWFGLT